MKLTVKMPLAFAAVLLVMLGAALAGLYGVHQSLDRHAAAAQAGELRGREIQGLALAFKTQVQEWKNTLLRGKDPKALDKHWQAFLATEGQAQEASRRLTALLPAGEARAAVDKFGLAHQAMGKGYRQAFEAFKAAAHDPAAGDIAVRGMDREPSKLLDEAARVVQVENAAQAAQAVADSRRTAVGSLVLMLLVSGAGMVGAALFSRAVIRPVAQAVAVARAVAAGDLSRTITVQGDGEVAQLLAALREMQTGLAQVVGSVRQNSDALASASVQIAAGNAQLASRTERQAQAVAQTASSMAQLNATAAMNADSAEQADQFARQASAVALRGGGVVGQAVSTMQGIHDSSRKIAEIISVIDGIAFQTNILALNAAVEAARAGEQGRGFAVVASEVRGLAGRSAEAAREIKGLITASVERVEQGSALVDQAGKTMTEVVASIQRVTDIMADISRAGAEQRAGVAQLDQAIGQLDHATQQNASMVEEGAAAAASLKGQAQQLVQTVAVFKLAGSPA